MNSSETLNELYKALSAFQGEVKPALKERVNPFFHSRYANLFDLWEVCREPLARHGLCCLQILNEGMIITRLGHISGQWIEGCFPVPPNDGKSPQALGSAITYGRRYALAAILGLVADEDDDAEAAEGRGSFSQRAVPKFKPTDKLLSWVNSLTQKATAEGKFESALALVEERLKGKDLEWARERIISASFENEDKKLP